MERKSESKDSRASDLPVSRPVEFGWRSSRVMCLRRNAWPTVESMYINSSPLVDLLKLDRLAWSDDDVYPVHAREAFVKHVSCWI
jgi:hypothetical protein